MTPPGAWPPLSTTPTFSGRLLPGASATGPPAGSSAILAVPHRRVNASETRASVTGGTSPLTALKGPAARCARRVKLIILVFELAAARLIVRDCSSVGSVFAHPDRTVWLALMTLQRCMPRHEAAGGTILICRSHRQNTKHLPDHQTHDSPHGRAALLQYAHAFLSCTAWSARPMCRPTLQNCRQRRRVVGHARPLQLRIVLSADDGQ